jgi:hypothetical protein
MNLSIVIPTFQRPDLLHRILSSIEHAERPACLSEIVVVENGGHAGADDVCRDFSSRLPITYIYEAAPGLSNARNIGAKHCSGDILLFFDDDIRVCPETLTAYASAFERHGKSAFYGGPLTPDYETQPKEWLTEFLPPSARGFSLGTEEKIIPEPCLLGGNFAVPREPFEYLEGFDLVSATGSEGGGTGEEKRLQARLIEKGLSGMFVPGAQVGHFVPTDRCNPRFIRHRRWRRGYGFGQLYAIEGGPHKTFLRLPRWWWTHSLGHLSRYTVSTLRLRPRAERFHHLILTLEALGWAKGYRQQTFQNQATDTATN